MPNVIGDVLTVQGATSAFPGSVPTATWVSAMPLSGSSTVQARVSVLFVRIAAVIRGAGGGVVSFALRIVTSAEVAVVPVPTPAVPVTRSFTVGPTAAAGMRQR